jgi:hypothetical protein
LLERPGRGDLDVDVAAFSTQMRSFIDELLEEAGNPGGRSSWPVGRRCAVGMSL